MRDECRQPLRSDGFNWGRGNLETARPYFTTGPPPTCFLGTLARTRQHTDNLMQLACAGRSHVTPRYYIYEPDATVLPIAWHWHSHSLENFI